MGMIGAAGSISSQTGAPDAGQLSLDILMSPQAIPAQETTYLCTHVEVPHDVKYHIIAAEGMVGQALLQQAMLHECLRSACTLRLPLHHIRQFDCTHRNARAIQVCANVVLRMCHYSCCPACAAKPQCERPIRSGHHGCFASNA